MYLGLKRHHQSSWKRFLESPLYFRASCPCPSYIQLEAKPALMACIAAAAPASPEPTIIDGNKAYSLFVAELDRQLKATENPRNLTAAGRAPLLIGGYVSGGLALSPVRYSL
jgi:hypothetical protein